MLGRVQRELATVHPLSLYRKQNTEAHPNARPNSRMSQTFVFMNGGTSTSFQDTNGPTNVSAKRRIQRIINEVKERREIRERKKSELQGFDGSELELDQFLDPEFTKTKYYKEKLNVYNFLNSPQVLARSLFNYSQSESQILNIFPSRDFGPGVITSWSLFWCLLV